MVLGTLLALAIVIVLVKLGIFRKLLPYHGYADVAITLGLVLLFGTESVAAFTATIIAGLVISLVLWIMASTVPGQRLRTGRGADGRRTAAWVDTEPTGR